MTDLAGSMLGPYEILERIGKGGMATVYRARQPSINRIVAIKVLPREFLHDDTFLARFKREVEVIASLQHPRILPVYDFGEEDGLPFIVMAYMEGGTLADRIKQGPMPLDEVVRLVGQIAEGLGHAHREGVIHRDFKPSNVLFDGANNVYLADFGIAKVTEATAQLTGSAIIGTPAYIAPEVARKGGLTSQVDVYALGVTLYQMSTGELPYQADTAVGALMAHVTEPIPDARKLRPDLPDAVQTVIERAMAKDPAERYPTARQLSADLRAAVAGEPLMPTVTGPTVKVDAPPPVKAPPTPVDVPGLPPAAMPTRDGVNPLWIAGGVGALSLLVGLAAVLTLASLLGRPAPTFEPMDAQPSDRVTVPPTRAPSPTNALKSTELPRSITDERGTEMVLVPAGEFLMGSTEEDIRAANKMCKRVTSDCERALLEDELPQHSVYLDAFYVDRTEVTNAQYAECVEDGHCDAPESWNSYSRHTYYRDPEYANHPVIYVSWYDADTYCRWRGDRLLTEAEWEKAARFDPDTDESYIYPWGNEFDGSLLNFCDRNCPFDWRDNEINDWFTDTTPVGNYPAGVSPFGALDMAGNVWEWVADWYQANYYAGSPSDNPAGPSSGTYRVMRGGGWAHPQYRARTTFRFRDYPNTATPRGGIRCARDAP